MEFRENRLSSWTVSPKFTKPRAFACNIAIRLTMPIRSCMILFDYHVRANRDGADLWGLYGTLAVSLTSSAPSSTRCKASGAWDEAVNKTPHDQKLANWPS